MVFFEFQVKLLFQNDFLINVEILMNDFGSFFEEIKFSEVVILVIVIFSLYVEDRVCFFFVEVLLMSLFLYFFFKELCLKLIIIKLQVYVFFNIDEGFYIEGYG